ncbi:MAG: amino acid ABC transporter substrate-binding protein [Pedobacter sp.]|nr:MAG: amino acid ABC transporter substrate-binding protein [Pedobacter sp.]
MISAQNHLQLSSGNKYWLVIFLGLLLSACSPKVQPIAKKKPVETKKEEEKVEKPVAKFTEAGISLLLPFRLNAINLKTADKAEVERSAMAIDFYQGFKMGVDSAAADGLNFKLNVFDSRDNNTQIEGLMQNGALLNKNLIVGPIFPEGLKHIRDYSVAKGIPVVNPLAATHPREIANPNMISIVNNIDLHAEKIGNYILKHYNPSQTVVVLINTGNEDSEMLAKPLKAFLSDPKQPFYFQEFASVFTMELKIIKNKKYVIVVTSPDKKFVIPTIDKLIKLKNAGLAVDLYGHPDWAKQGYSTDKLQALNTIITSSYKVDYTRKEVNAFVKKYRAAYRFEPGEYAFKGFDTGFYFARLLAEHGPKYVDYLVKEKYRGLHNSFTFIHDSKLGYINTSLMLLKYHNFALNVVE